ncbi:MAG: ABC transporter ATP-binding protein, partial [Actinomyces sp.]
MLLRLLRTHLRPYTGLLVCVLVLQFAEVMASLYLPTLNADIIDKGVATGDTGYIWRMGAFMLGVSLAQGVCTVLATYLAARAAMSMGRDLRGEVFDRVSGFSEREISAFGAGSLITRNTNDVQQVQMLVMMSATMLVTAPFMALGGIFMAVTRAPGLSWLIGVSVPILLVAVGLIVGRMLPLFRSYQDKLDAINRVMREQLTGIRVIRAFVREEAETERFEDANGDIARVGERVGQLFVLLFPLVMLVLDVTIVGVIWFGGHRVGDGDVEVGTLIAFMSYLMQILMGIVMASFMTIMIPRAAVCAERISEVLATSPTITSSPDAVDTFPAPGTVEMRDVTFVYPDADARVLAEVSFTVQPGTTTAIVGSTASGKSTVVRLLARLLQASSGQVLIGGTDVREADPEALWAQMGLVPQQPFLFAGTV